MSNGIWIFRSAMHTANRRKSCALNPRNAHIGALGVRVGALTNKAAHNGFDLVRTVWCALFGLTSISGAAICNICRERRGTAGTRRSLVRIPTPGCAQRAISCCANCAQKCVCRARECAHCAACAQLFVVSPRSATPSICLSTLFLHAAAQAKMAGHRQAELDCFERRRFVCK